MGFPILVRWHLYIDSAPWLQNVKQLLIRGPFYWHGLISTPKWVSNYFHHTVWNEITYLFPNFNGQLLKFGNEKVISSNFLLGIWLSIHAMIKVNSFLVKCEFNPEYICYQVSVRQLYNWWSLDFTKKIGPIRWNWVLIPKWCFDYSRSHLPNWLKKHCVSKVMITRIIVVTVLWLKKKSWCNFCNWRLNTWINTWCSHDTINTLPILLALRVENPLVMSWFPAK